MRLATAVTAIAAAGCFAPDRGTPERAFSRLAPCVDRADAKCLFRELDRDSRWSVASIAKLIGEMNRLIERDYPPAARAGALGAWREEAGATDPADLFDIFCRKRRCLDRLSAGFGAVAAVTFGEPGEATVETVRGGVFTMSSAGGEWGLAVFRDELEAAKLHLGDSLDQVRRNAAEFVEKRLAGAEGSSEP